MAGTRLRCAPPTTAPWVSGTVTTAIIRPPPAQCAPGSQLPRHALTHRVGAVYSIAKISSGEYGAEMQMDRLSAILPVCTSVTTAIIHPPSAQCAVVAQDSPHAPSRACTHATILQLEGGMETTQRRSATQARSICVMMAAIRPPPARCATAMHLRVRLSWINATPTCSVPWHTGTKSPALPTACAQV